MPKTYNCYFEPFIGGGALLFSVSPKDFVINDFNSELIQAYHCFTNESDFKKLLEALDFHQMHHGEEHYYEVRNMDKKPDFLSLPIYERAARMIYLNKSCFNGLYRVNRKGYFNLPSGRKKR
jgi:DNA adenine methylase